MTMASTAEGFRSPMLATATTKLPPGTWIAEEKYDGHRLIVAVRNGSVKAWSRLANTRELPTRIVNTLKKLPSGIYDGELIVPQGYSSSVSDLSNQSLLEFVVFDLLETAEKDTTALPWNSRRSLLQGIFSLWEDNAVVSLAEYVEVRTWQHVIDFVDTIWSRGGEGAILKDVNAPYRVGKRTKTFLKVKQLQSVELTIIGFAPSEGEIMQYGAYGTAVLQDEEGVIVPVKVLDDHTRASLIAQSLGKPPDGWKTVRLLSGTKVNMHTCHSWVGRRLHIEYQNRTPDGSYRHPRWDHLEGE